MYYLQPESWEERVYKPPFWSQPGELDFFVAVAGDFGRTTGDGGRSSPELENCSVAHLQQVSSVWRSHRPRLYEPARGRYSRRSVVDSDLGHLTRRGCEQTELKRIYSVYLHYIFKIIISVFQEKYSDQRSLFLRPLSNPVFYIVCVLCLCCGGICLNCFKTVKELFVVPRIVVKMEF